MTKRRSDVPVFLLYAGIIHAIGLALLLPILITLPGPGHKSAAVPETPAVGVVVLPPPQPLADVGPERTSALPSAARVGRGAAAPVAAEPEIGQEPKDDNAALSPAGEPEVKPAPQQAEPAPAEPTSSEPADDTKDALAHVGPQGEGDAEPKPQMQPAESEPQGKAREVDRPAKQEKAKETGPAKASVKAKDASPAKAAPRAARKPSARRSTAKAPRGRKSSRTAKKQTKFARGLSELFSPPAKKRK